MSATADMPKVRKVCFLDLEETVIDNFADCNLINREQIIDLLEKEKPDRINIFSFAIDGSKDMARFNVVIKPYLERELGIKIYYAWTVADIRKAVYRKTGVVFDDREFITVWGKLKAFQDFCLATEIPDSDCFLVDDAVPNTTFTYHDLNLTIRTITAPKYIGVVKNGY